MLYVQAVLGIFVFISLAVLFSEDRKIPHWKLIAAGLGLQFVFAFVVFQFNLLQQLLNAINRGVSAIVYATEAGTLFIFGYLGGDPVNVAYPFEVGDPGATIILAFRILPLILIFTVLSAILWHYRILPVIVRGFAYVLRRSLGVGGAVGLSAAANIFIGMVESPALIRPYIKALTRSELFIVMSVGMATIAGTVMVLYSADDIASDSKDFGPKYHNVMDAIARGTSDGVALMVNVGAMLLVLVALVALLNSALSVIPMSGNEPITLQRLFGYIFAPLVWFMGVPWSEAQTAGSLMGIKTALNELLAFLAMAELPSGALSEKSQIIMTYAICGFANFGSLGIMIAGLSGMCRERAQEIVSLAPKSILSGTLATCLTGAIAGLLY